MYGFWGIFLRFNILVRDFWRVGVNFLLGYFLKISKRRSLNVYNVSVRGGGRDERVWEVSMLEWIYD